MKRMTLFTVPRTPGQDDRTDARQRRAIRSWQRLRPCPAIWLLGDAPTEQAASAWAVRFRPVDFLAYGTPLVRDAFLGGMACGPGPWAYVNADIVLRQDFLVAAQRCARLHTPWLMIGRRVESATGRLGDAWHIDYFVFSSAVWDLSAMPDFYLGRTKWDNWLVAAALARGTRVFDVTAAVRATHLSHERGHKQADAIAHNERIMDRPCRGIHDATHEVQYHGRILKRAPRI